MARFWARVPSSPSLCTFRTPPIFLQSLVSTPCQGHHLNSMTSLRPPPLKQPASPFPSSPSPEFYKQVRSFRGHGKIAHLRSLPPLLFRLGVHPLISHRVRNVGCIPFFFFRVPKRAWQSVHRSFLLFGIPHAFQRWKYMWMENDPPDSNTTSWRTRIPGQVPFLPPPPIPVLLDVRVVSGPRKELSASLGGSPRAIRFRASPLLMERSAKSPFPKLKDTLWL